jgi:hypothetical protein
MSKNILPVNRLWLDESGDTVTENILFAAARFDEEDGHQNGQRQLSGFRTSVYF